MDKNRRKSGIPAKKRPTVSTPAKTPPRSAYQAVHGTRSGEVVSPPNPRPIDTPGLNTQDALVSPDHASNTSRDITPRQAESPSADLNTVQLSSTLAQLSSTMAETQPRIATGTVEKDISSTASLSEPISSMIDTAKPNDTSVEKKEPKPVDEANANTTLPSSDKLDDAWGPLEELVRFDNNLLQQFEQEMDLHAEKERHLMDKLTRLNIMHQAWAISGSNQEIERNSKRLRTRVAYVHHRETELVKSYEQFQYARANVEKAMLSFDD